MQDVVDEGLDTLLNESQSEPTVLLTFPETLFTPTGKGKGTQGVIKLI